MVGNIQNIVLASIGRNGLKLKRYIFCKSFQDRPTVCQLFLLWQWWMVCLMVGSLFITRGIGHIALTFFELCFTRTDIEAHTALNAIESVSHHMLISTYFLVILFSGLVFFAVLLLSRFLARYIGEKLLPFLWLTWHMFPVVCLIVCALARHYGFEGAVFSWQSAYFSVGVTYVWFLIAIEILVVILVLSFVIENFSNRPVNQPGNQDDKNNTTKDLKKAKHTVKGIYKSCALIRASAKPCKRGSSKQSSSEEFKHGLVCRGK